MRIWIPTKVNKNFDEFLANYSLLKAKIPKEQWPILDQLFRTYNVLYNAFFSVSSWVNKFRLMKVKEETKRYDA
jgi:hypothetical protein